MIILRIDSDEIANLSFVTQLRDDQGISITELSNRADVVRQTVINMENGSDPKWSTVLAVLSQLGCAIQIERTHLPSRKYRTLEVNDEF